VVAAISAWLPELTVGLVATLTTVACIIAADTGAYFVGKNLGRTKLTDISPKKTVEGAVGGLASAVAVAVLFWRLFSWPGSALAAAGYGVSCGLGGGRVPRVLRGTKRAQHTLCVLSWVRAVLHGWWWRHRASIGRLCHVAGCPPHAHRS
jgi:CDP-diglyceride synthetase